MTESRPGGKEKGEMSELLSSNLDPSNQLCWCGSVGVVTSAVKRSICFTIGFYNHGEVGAFSVIIVKSSRTFV